MLKKAISGVVLLVAVGGAAGTVDLCRFLSRPCADSEDNRQACGEIEAGKSLPDGAVPSQWIVRILEPG